MTRARTRRRHLGAETRAGRSLVRRVVQGAVAGIVTAVVVTGCSGAGTSGPPASTPTATARATEPTPSPSRSTAPARPAAMDRADLEGAAAAARYFLELYPYAYNTGDLTARKALSHPDCIFCASVVERVEALHAQGGYETGGDLTFESVTASEPIEGNPYYGVDITLYQHDGAKFSATGEAIGGFGDERSVASLALAAAVDGWVVREVSLEVTE